VANQCAYFGQSDYAYTQPVRRRKRAGKPLAMLVFDFVVVAIQCAYFGQSDYAYTQPVRRRKRAGKTLAMLVIDLL
jgi:hypothetical protein